MKLIPIRSKIKRRKFNLFKAIIECLKDAKVKLENNDILVISSKFVAMSEGRYIRLSKVKVGKEAKRIAKKYKVDERIAELVLKESDKIIGGTKGFLLALKDGILTPNAGIDRSNIFSGYAILLPKEPFVTADKIRKLFYERFCIKIGVIITDSRLMPTRIGTIGVAVGVSGFEPIRDERGKKDLFGKKIRVSRMAVADDISSAAQFLMGEANYATPIVVVKGANVKLTDRKLSNKDLSIDLNTCVFMRSLSFSLKGSV
jgi:coenzyme F420-0:L-glutamate ligase